MVPQSNNQPMLNIAVCLDGLISSVDGGFDLDWLAAHPGTRWMEVLRQQGIRQGAFRCVSGEFALAKIRSGEWEARNTLLIDELGSRVAGRLVRLGCTPFLQTAFEAPLYAPLFYDWAGPGEYRYVTRYMSKKCQTDRYRCQRFPSYEQSMLASDSVERRQRIVCVASNKYRAPDLDWSTVHDIPSSRIWLKHQIGKIVSRTYRYALSASLHGVRLRFLSEFSRAGILDLYGSLWGQPFLIPKKRRDLFGLVTLAWKGRVNVKQEVIRNYDFGLCIENMEMTGYVTEKIFDCIAAGVIPVYWGAPDITDFVPQGVFVDLRRFAENPAMASAFLSDMSFDDRENFRRAGRMFLDSAEGRAYSHEGYASWVLQLAMEFRFGKANAPQWCNG